VLVGNSKEGVLRRNRVLVRVFGIALACCLSVGASAADDGLELYREGETYLRPTITLEAAAFSESDAWLGESDSVIGDHVGYWYEYAIIPGLEGAFSLGGSGVLYGRASAVGAGSQGLDAAGSDIDDYYVEKLEAEDLYLGWRSGTLFPGLGENALDLSVGKQKYQIGNGFFMWDGASDGGKRGAFWIAPRKAFYMTAIARLNTGPYKLEAFYLKPNDEAYTSTDVYGGNFEYTAGETGTLGVSYLKIANSKRETRDGMNYFDWRADLTPLPSDRSFFLSGEWALEVNGSSQDSTAWYGEAGYAFDETDWKPSISYRYSWFEGDDPSSTGDLEIWDPLWYGFNDWSTWYVGEIIGGFVALNRDLAMQTVRLRLQPSEALSVQLIYNYYTLIDEVSELVARDLNPRAGNIHSQHIGQGLDLVADWTANDHLSFSGVVAAFDPGAGAQQYIDTNSGSIWMHFMLYTKVSF
jgi:hypothetical protein